MGTARDIALIFLSLEALVIALVPMVLLGGLAYGVYRLIGLTRMGLRKALGYAQQGQLAVERGAQAAAAPLVKVYAMWNAVIAVLQGLNRRVR